MFAKKLKEVRAQKGISQAELARQIGVSQQAVAKWETEKATPDPEMLSKIADFFLVSTDYLLGRPAIKTHNPLPDDLPPLTAKDERDIARDLEEMMKSLSGEEANGKNTISFYGQPMSDEEKEMMRLSIENSLRIAKQMAKKKFTPKKYRKAPIPPLER